MSRAGLTGKQRRVSAARTQRSGPPRRLPLTIKAAVAAAEAVCSKTPPELEAALHAEPRPTETTARPPIRGPPVAHACYSIKTFCQSHHLSEAMFHKMREMGIGPDIMKVGRRVLISFESAAKWRAERERAAATAAE
jgi:hypothetical protein